MNEYKQRRQKVIEAIGKDSVAIFFAAKTAYRSGHTEYAYRQDSDFYYLTGYCEPNAVLVIAPNEGTPVILFNQSLDEKAERWTGKRIGQQKAVDDYGVDAAFPIEKLEEKLPILFSNKKVIYFPWGEVHIREKMSKCIKKSLEITRHMPWPDLIAAQKLIASMRAIKTPAEINLLRESARISAHAHKLAMQKVKPGMMEYQLAAEYIYEFTQKGALDIAYLPIVGGGKNACTLHYVANQDRLNDSELVLVDAGCSYQYYCADVTRTFPVNGRFTKEQRALYDVVLAAYLAGREKFKPGNDWPMVLKAVDESLAAGLRELNIPNEVKEFFMHGPGHWLGLDVHDVGPYKNEDKPVPFQPGMVLTLEPGLYIEEPAQVDKKWWNIGIRIEDDILITDTGHEVLSMDAPIAPDDIEQLMR